MRIGRIEQSSIEPQKPQNCNQSISIQCFGFQMIVLTDIASTGVLGFVHVTAVRFRCLLSQYQNH